MWVDFFEKSILTTNTESKYPYSLKMSFKIFKFSLFKINISFLLWLVIYIVSLFSESSYVSLLN